MRNVQPAACGRRRLSFAPARLAGWVAGAAVACAVGLGGAAYGGPAGSALPLADVSPRPHEVGDVFTYSLHGTLSQAIAGTDPFGHAIHQAPAPTDLQGHERVAVKSVSARGISLHRSGSILATFNGRSSPAQSGSAWTFVTPLGDVQDRKGSTLGGLFLLPLGFLGDRAVNGGAALAVGSRWSGKLGMALFGMVAHPRMQYQVVGSRTVLGVAVYTLAGSGTVDVKEPIVTNEGVALGNAAGVAHVSMRCDYDPHSLRAVAMDIDVVTNLRMHGRRNAAAGSVSDRQHYLVALDAASMRSAGMGRPDPPAPVPAVSPASNR